MTAAQYLAKFETANTLAISRSTTSPGVGCSAGQVAGVWAFLYSEKSTMDQLGIAPSAKAEEFATRAEAALAKAYSYLSGFSVKADAAVSHNQTASNLALLFAKQARLDAGLPA